MPNLYIIAGCNGAGKTTTAYTVLPDILRCCEFVNADEIARGLSPFNYDDVAISAGRLMVERIEELMNGGGDFACETTLASRSYYNIILEARMKGYKVMMVYIYLQTPEIAIQRVADRVVKGGHNIPEETIRRRYARSLRNLFEVYLELVDFAVIADNSNAITIIAEKERGKEIKIANHTLYDNITRNRLL